MCLVFFIARNSVWYSNSTDVLIPFILLLLHDIDIVDSCSVTVYMKFLLVVTVQPLSIENRFSSEFAFEKSPCGN
jgi:hypothetical protein